MSLKDQITEDMKTAMRAKDSERLLTVRTLLAAMKQKEVDEIVKRGNSENKKPALGVPSAGSSVSSQAGNPAISTSF